MNPVRQSSLRLALLLAVLVLTLQSCYHYRVQTTQSDPGTEYQQKTVKAYFWGLMNNPKDLIVPNCNNNNALDEVVYSKNFGQCLVTFVTLGIYSPVQVKWKCHKPPVRQGEL